MYSESEDNSHTTYKAWEEKTSAHCISSQFGQLTSQLTCACSQEGSEREQVAGRVRSKGHNPSPLAWRMPPGTVQSLATPALSKGHPSAQQVSSEGSPGDL